jgi:hypothetical protein
LQLVEITLTDVVATTTLTQVFYCNSVLRRRVKLY